MMAGRIVDRLLSVSGALWTSAALLAAPACAPEAPEPPGADLRVVVISDINSSYGSVEYEPEVTRAVRLIREAWQPDLVLAAGDLIAGQKPELPDERVRQMWAAFDSVVAQPLRDAGIPFGFTLGNHDGSAYPAHARDRRIALRHWRAPDRDPRVELVDRARFPVYYSFREGDLFVLVWDATNQETARNDTVMSWVRAQLESEAARSARFRWVLGHLPLYGIAEGRDRPGEVLAEADELRALLEAHDVQMYISGHQHAFYPGRRGSLCLLHAGALGQGARPLIAGNRPPQQTVTILDLRTDAGTIAATTFGFPQSSEGALRRVRIEDLPPRLEGHNGPVERWDLTTATDEAPQCAVSTGEGR